MAGEECLGLGVLGKDGNCGRSPVTTVRVHSSAIYDEGKGKAYMACQTRSFRFRKAIFESIRSVRPSLTWTLI